jgi:hypothetical protein
MDISNRFSLVDFLAYFFPGIFASLVSELMPNSFVHTQRQSSLRQLRMNMLPGVIIWLIAGIGWGVTIIQLDVPKGILLILASVILSGLTFYSLLDRMKSNEEREVREVLTAFVAGYWANIIPRRDEEATDKIETGGKDGI